MPIARFQMPDGRIARFEVPEGTRPEDAQAMIEQSMQTQSNQPSVTKETPWSQVAEQAVSNIPSSVGNILGGIKETVQHPIQTGRNLWDIAAGGLQNVLPESLVQAVGEDSPSREKAGAVGQFYKQRYGSEEGFKQALAQDPAGVMADAATVLTGGGALAAKVPGLAKAGHIVQKAGTVIDPLRIAAKTAGLGVDIGKGIAKHTLGLTTGAGSQAIEQAFKAGKAGGLKQATFASNLRGNVPKEAVLDAVDANIQAMGQARSASYKAGMAKLGRHPQVLDYQKITDAAKDAMKISTYTGKNTGMTVSTARSTLPMQQKIADLINEWRNLDPADFHTAEGLDALKKNIGDLRDSTQYGTPERLVADKVYHAVKNQIVNQAPDYANTMKNYQQATELLSEIRSTLSHKPNASVDAQMRKLQSLMRNDVATNYGNRLDLVKQLEAQGGHDILPAVAGQALSSVTPRGLQTAATIPTTVVSGAVGGLPLAAANLLASSPRLAGEASLLAGRGARYAGYPVETANRLADILGVNPTVAGNILYQLNQPKEQQTLSNVLTGR